MYCWNSTWKHHPFGGTSNSHSLPLSIAMHLFMIYVIHDIEIVWLPITPFNCDIYNIYIIQINLRKPLDRNTNCTTTRIAYYLNQHQYFMRTYFICETISTVWYPFDQLHKKIPTQAWRSPESVDENTIHLGLPVILAVCPVDSLYRIYIVAYTLLV